MKIKKIAGSLWFSLVLLGLVSNIAALILTNVVFIVLVMLKIIVLKQDTLLLSWLPFNLFSSVFIGTAITAYISRKILKSTSDLSSAAREVAKGNFDVRLPDEQHRIHELREMAANFNKMVHELSGIETLRKDFIVNVSHEFKTPIAAIEGYAALMQDEDLSTAERQEYGRRIIESTKQLSSLTSNILRLSKLENQGVVVDKVQFQLDEQIRFALLMLEAQWSGKNIDLDISLAPVQYYGSEELLMQVWLNLLGNAIKFSNDEGALHVSLAHENDYITVIISDTGIGMNEEVVQHIFDKFYQGDTSRKAEGNGLGLPLVKRVVDLCEGTIQVSSVIGAGSTFTVTLPNNSV